MMNNYLFLPYGLKNKEFKKSTKMNSSFCLEMQIIYYSCFQQHTHFLKNC